MTCKISRLSVIAALAMCFGAVPAVSADLVTPVPGGANPPIGNADKTVKRQRLVNVDASVLADAVVSLGIDAAADRAERSRQRGGKLRLRLFDDAVADLKRESVEAAMHGGIVWEGTASSGGTAIFVVRNGLVTGHIDLGGKSFLIDPTGSGGLHLVREIDPEKLPRDRHIKVPRDKLKTKRAPAPAPDTARAGTPTEVTLLATYTAKAKSHLGVSFEDKITLDVARSNKALKNSGVNIRIVIAGFAAVSSSYNELLSSDSGEPLDAITSGNSFNFPSLRQLRTSKAADLVTMYSMREEYCGLAWVLDGGFGDDDFAFSVINARCQGSLTLAHELGHNMGLHHDRYVEDAAPVSEYNFGYVSIPGRFRTVMSYSDECRDRGVTCKEISYYSTPRVTLDGRPLGIAGGRKGAADSAKALNENRSWIADFR